MKRAGFDGKACTRVRSYLDSYLNGELLVETIHGIEQHLAGCATCANELEARARLKKMLQRAVSQEVAPAHLRARIQTGIRASQPSPILSYFSFNAGRAWFVTCGALVVLCLAMWGVWRVWSSGGRDGADRTIIAQTRKVLDIGFRDHVDCALDNRVRKTFFTFEQVPAALKPEYGELIAAVRGQVGDDYEVAWHNCEVEGREFIHLVLERGDTVLSLVMTKENREGFESRAHDAQSFDSAGAPLYAGRLQNFAVVGFQTASHLAFVVSNLPEKENLRFAESVAPSARGFLKKMETGV